MQIPPWLAAWRERVPVTGPFAPAAALAGAAVTVGVVLVVGVMVWRGPPPPAEASLPRATPAAASATARDDGGSAAPSPSGPVVVHAAGAVVRPGLYRLRAGARVADLIDAAGGPTADADVDQLNLAALLSDGERIHVPRRGEAVADVAAGAAGGSASAIVNLNTATLEQLDSLPGVGPSTAQAILDYRKSHGRFRSVRDLLDVRGIGEAKFAELKARVRV